MSTILLPKKYSIGVMTSTSHNHSKKNAKKKKRTQNSWKGSCRIMVDRFNSIHNDEYVDSYCGVNRVIGAAFLMVTLSRQDKNRGNEIDRYTRFVTLCISAKKTPYLWNLARSGRFFVVGSSDDAEASSFRTTAIDSLQMQLSEIYSDTNINLWKHFKRQEAVLSRMENSLERRISRLIYHLIGIAIVLVVIYILLAVMIFQSVYWFDRMEQSILKLSAQDFNRGPNCNCKHWSLPYTVYDFEDTTGN